MKKQNVNQPMPTIAMVGLCLSLLAFVFTVVASSSMGFLISLVGFTTSIGATMMFGGVLLAWVRA